MLVQHTTSWVQAGEFAFKIDSFFHFVITYIEFNFVLSIFRILLGSGLPKAIFLAIAEAEGEGGKTSAIKVEAEGEAKGLVFCI